jgi:uncharacterized membrane protein YqhA
MPPPQEARALRPLPGFIFASRWLQLPLYLGLPLAAFGSEQALNHVLDAVTVESRLGLESHPDQPEWLSHVNASVLKVKLATAHGEQA